MSLPAQLPLTGLAHHNQQLFSDHYLDGVLPERPDWRALEASAATKLEEISRILDDYVPSDNEAQTERDLVRKVLEALNHTFEVQAGLRTSAGVQFPDYVFYRDVESVNANKGKTLTDELLEAGGLAVGDAKYWDRPLDM